MRNKVSTCPWCGGDVFENDWCYFCANRKWNSETKSLEEGSCKFKIQKQTQNYEINLETLQELIENGRTSTPIVHGVRPKSKTQWSAYLVLDPDTEDHHSRYATAFEFVEN